MMRRGFAYFVKRPSQVPGTSHDAVSIHYCFHLGWPIEMGFVRTLIIWASISKQILHQKHHKGIRKCRKWIMHVMYPFILTVDKFLLTEMFIKTVMCDLFFLFLFFEIPNRLAPLLLLSMITLAVWATVVTVCSWARHSFDIFFI